jgi:hypothetical protein
LPCDFLIEIKLKEMGFSSFFHFFNKVGKISLTTPLKSLKKKGVERWVCKSYAFVPQNLCFWKIKAVFSLFNPYFFARLKMLFVRKREKQRCNKRLKK